MTSGQRDELIDGSGDGSNVSITPLNAPDASPNASGDRPSTVTCVLSDAQATHDLGMILGRSLPAGTNLLLYGNLGSGKTTHLDPLATIRPP